MSKKTNPSRPAVIYISHGGGPLPLLGEESHGEMVAGLEHIAHLLPKPKAIIVISAHWQEDRPTITSGAYPSLIYDYGGFPEEAYDIKYPAPGKPQLANKVFDVLKRNDIDAELSIDRGFDHGLFIPLKIMYPEADIPCVQISLVNTFSPAEHIQIGKALAGLEEDKVLVIGSGFSFHNLKAFFMPPTQEIQGMNESFEQWLIDTCTNPELKERDREQRLIDWENGPAARFCHPREDHLIPLHVCYGLAQREASQVFKWTVMGKKVSAYLW